MQQPAMVYGTAWKETRTASLVVQAVLAGFRGIDTACQPKHYRQDLVGEALAQLRTQHGIKREQLWIQTKFTSLDGQDLSKPLPYDKDASLAQQVQQSFETSLKQLGTDYIDSLIMHSPMRTREDTHTVWSEFEKLVHRGKVREIGISNIYDLKLFDWCFDTFEIKPSTIQNRFSEEHLSFCAPILERLAARFEKGHPLVHLQTFWTLTANPLLLPLNGPLAPFVEARRSVGLSTTAQALYALLMTSPRWPKGMIVPLSGTTNEEHMRHDVQVVKLVEGGWDEESSEKAARDKIEKFFWD